MLSEMIAEITLKRKKSHTCVAHIRKTDWRGVEYIQEQVKVMQIFREHFTLFKLFFKKKKKHL